MRKLKNVIGSIYVRRIIEVLTGSRPGDGDTCDHLHRHVPTENQCLRCVGQKKNPGLSSGVFLLLFRAGL